jgi:hypothetical protein
MSAITGDGVSHLDATSTLRAADDVIAKLDTSG